MCTWVSTEFELGQCGESLQRVESDKPLFIFTAFNIYIYIYIRYIKVFAIETVRACTIGKYMIVSLTFCCD